MLRNWWSGPGSVGHFCPAGVRCVVWVGVCLGIVAWECWCEFCVSVFSLCISLY